MSNAHFFVANTINTLFCRKNVLSTLVLLQKRFRPESFCALKVSIRKVQTFWADAYYHGMSREISIPVPEPHHPLRANGPFQRLCLPLPSLEALWGHACLRLTRLDAPGAFSFSFQCLSSPYSLGYHRLFEQLFLLCLISSLNSDLFPPHLV